MGSYVEAIAVTQTDSGDFDPKVQQKAVYKWYDSRYSDEALDIYSEAWKLRILQWHQEAKDKAADGLKSKESLDTLEFGSFFLSHPIAAFSLWQVLQACYELDRAVCGTTIRDFEEIKSWQKSSPFHYLRDNRVQLKWKASLEDLKDRIKNQDVDIDVKEEPWELRMYDILLGVERFEDSFAVLKENFSANLAGMDYATWMIDRIDEDIGKRFAMITDLLEFKEHELAGLQPAETTETGLPVGSAPQYTAAPPPPPKYKRTWTRRSQNQNLTLDTSEPASKSRFGFKSGINVIKGTYRKQKDFVKSLSHR